MSQKALTPAEYWSEVQLLSTEIEAAIVIYYTYEEINRLAVHDKRVLRSLNEDPLFWRTQVHCLQASLFLTLSRIFDLEANAHTIHTLINATLGNLQLFSAAALSSRKMSGGPRPDWLDSFVASAWIPTNAKELRHLKTSLAPHTRRFQEVYRPIRHAIYAHRLMSDEQAGVQLFGGTNRERLQRFSTSSTI
ncbi:MAG TPA: hypothetical protein VN893_07875 [Bryobacteraceae bacterium]|nr:hypothetical protein [Bryobacteraceae bacterium]